MANNFNIEQFLDLTAYEQFRNSRRKGAGGRRFDVCLMNPPYGNRNIGDEFIHHKFTEKCLEISDNVICVMPAKLCMYDTSKDKNRKYFKQIYNDRLTEVEAVDSKLFSGTAMMMVGIHTFRKNNNKLIHLINLNKSENDINSLFDLSQFNNYEKEISKYLEINIDETNCYLCQVGKNEELLNKWIKNIQKHNKNVYLTTNSANGGMNGTFFSKTVGKIFNNANDLKNNFKERRGAVCNIMLFNSLLEAENCRDAMKRPLLRFALYRTQDDQNIRKKCFTYIPAIDWEDDRVKTDEGLLEVCGCPKDKCKEYADYCKKIIDKLDAEK